VAAETHSVGKTPQGVDDENKYHFKFEVKGDKVRRVRAYNDTALIKEVILGK
jgi:ketosteroid isomerase-like protein